VQNGHKCFSLQDRRFWVSLENCRLYEITGQLIKNLTSDEEFAALGFSCLNCLSEQPHLFLRVKRSDKSFWV
jgi:hypothetical protein